MTILTQEGDGTKGKRIIYVARRTSGPRLIMKGRTHRGLEGVLNDAKPTSTLPSKNNDNHRSQKFRTLSSNRILVLR